MATPISIAAPRPAPFFTPLFVAIDRGFLAEEGLEGTMRYRLGLEALEKGEVDFSFGGSAYRAFLAGSDVRMVCGHATRETSHVLMVRPEIETVQQLEHVILPGASGAGDRFVNELRSILALHGVDLQQSGIATEGIEGSHPEQWKLLKQGVADGGTLGAPWWIFAAREGYRNMGSEADYAPNASGSGIYVTSQKIARDPEVVQAFVRAFVKSVRYCAQNPEGAMETMLRYSNEWGVDDPEIARAVYDEVAPYWNVDVDTPTLDRLMKQASARSGKPAVPVEAFLDLHFLQEAQGT